LIDTVLGSGQKSGYNFTGIVIAATSGAPAQFGGRATPVTSGGVVATGTRNFAILTEGVLYAGDTTTAGAAVSAGPPLAITGATALNN
jgi:hypothetical protein